LEKLILNDDDSMLTLSPHPETMAAISSAPAPSALSAFIASKTQRPADPVIALTLQVYHNLEHQHLWTSLQIHEPRTLSPQQSIPLISGRPPQCLYTHPDEQAYLLEHGIRLEDIEVEREWVIPTADGQTWSLRRLAEVFDALPDRREGLGVHPSEGEVSEKIAAYQKVKHERSWGGKRLLLSVVDRRHGGEGTVVYYVVLEGTVKPRQN
jgi:hypothetical protein